MRKYDICRLLGQCYGYKSYLEICTSVTGLAYAHVDKEQFPRCARLMYRRPPEFFDTETIDFSTAAESSEELFAEIMTTGEKFDVVFVDPWHTYTCSLRDINFALQLVQSDGVVVVHDCNPPDASCAVPDFFHGEWCGVTFAAYLDVVLSAGELHHVTVDCDYGCGIITKKRSSVVHSGFSADAALVSQWRTLDLSQKYAFFAENRAGLLNLISPSDFICGLPMNPSAKSAG